MLSTITTLIAVITHRPPTPFGTQHIALILAGWGPIIVFSELMISPLTIDPKLIICRPSTCCTENLFDLAALEEKQY
jgi:hypothetical protein